MTKSIFAILFWAFITVFFLTGPNSVVAASKITPPENFSVINNLQNDWLVYNSTYKNYVPYSLELNESSKYVSVYLDLIKNRNYFILLKTESQSYLFLEGALQREIPKESWQVLRIDSLYRIYKKDEILLTLYGNPGIAEKELLIANKRSVGEKELATSSSFINIRPIEFTSFGNFAVLAVILLLILNAWIFNANPLIFARFINPVEFFKNDPRDQLSKTNKPFGNTVIFFVVIVALATAFVLIFLATNKINLFSVSSLLYEKANTIQLLGDFFMLSVIFFLLLYGKYILMVMVGNMLNIDKFVDVLFIKIIQSSYLFYVLMFLLAFVLSFNEPALLNSVKGFVLVPFLIFYIARTVILYIVTLPQGSYINLYLFSYLCVMEIIPLLVAVKFA